jgi:serine/threonine-protein kinase
VQAGDLISGKYRLQRMLGAGSMGSVWAARNELTNRDFAVKFLLPQLAKNEEALNRFFLEARACGQIRHPAIVDVYDMGRAENGSPYLVMELLEGEGFDQRLMRQSCMRAVDVCRHLSIVARGLEEAHTRGLIHRDLKPGNIFFAIDSKGEVVPKVLDFGISKEITEEQFEVIKTSTGTVLGSPAYMSPEQARGELDIDARTDVWALGVIIYEAVSGELPFDANNYNALMICIISEPHRPLGIVHPEVPPELATLVDRALAKDRNQRIRSAGELADELERIYATLTGTPLTRPERVLTIPPIEGVTQVGWFRSRAATARAALPRRVVVAAGFAVAALVAGALALGSAAAPTAAALPGATMSGALAAQVARSHSALALELAREKDAAEAREVAARAPSSAVKPAEPPRPSAAPPPRKPPGPDPHGGVVAPGF